MINKSNYSYKINLPGYTDKKVIEWFEELSNVNRLSEDIIALVFEHVYSSESSISKNSSEEKTKSKIVETSKNNNGNEDDFFSNLYNWQDSNNMIHREESRKEKKRMLTV